MPSALNFEFECELVELYASFMALGHSLHGQAINFSALIVIHADILPLEVIPTEKKKKRKKT